ncbi:MAG: hypothetical protein MNPFHGCM_03282 [Gemmatimonadaceae bacterium]|nr:hypothetical protein [Gemmatimonadaceae bacterium]
MRVTVVDPARRSARPVSGLATAPRVRARQWSFDLLSGPLSGTATTLNCGSLCSTHAVGTESLQDQAQPQQRLARSESFSSTRGDVSRDSGRSDSPGVVARCGTAGLPPATTSRARTRPRPAMTRPQELRARATGLRVRCSASPDRLRPELRPCLSALNSLIGGRTLSRTAFATGSSGWVSWARN